MFFEVIFEQIGEIELNVHVCVEFLYVYFCRC